MPTIHAPAPRRLASGPYVLNVNASQLVSVAYAKLGYNLNNTFNPTGLAFLKAGGATYARFQSPWDVTESYASPGTYSLSSSIETALAYCGENGIKPIAVCC